MIQRSHKIAADLSDHPGYSSPLALKFAQEKLRQAVAAGRRLLDPASTPPPRGVLPLDLSSWTHVDLQNDLTRIWTSADLAKGISIGNYGQMRPLFRRLEGGLPVTVLAMGDSIAGSYGGCFHRDK